MFSLCVTETDPHCSIENNIKAYFKSKNPSFGETLDNLSSNYDETIDAINNTVRKILINNDRKNARDVCNILQMHLNVIKSINKKVRKGFYDSNIKIHNYSFSCGKFKIISTVSSITAIGLVAIPFFLNNGINQVDYKLLGIGTFLTSVSVELEKRLQIKKMFDNELKTNIISSSSVLKRTISLLQVPSKETSIERKV